MSNLKQNFTTPIGRFVWGSMKDAQTKDAEGKPLVVKNGPDAGKPAVRYAFGVAIPKTPGQTHWAQKPAGWDEQSQGKYWGELVWAVGHASFPNGQAQRPDFAWKVTDGDSTIPNKKGRKPCDQEGYPGHWVLSFSSSFAPKTFNANGSAPVDPTAIKTGHYVQVAGTVDGNASDNQPGIYLNHNMVAHAGFGPEIFSGPDPTQAGFGRGPAPAGMQSAPVAALPVPGAAPAALPPPAAVAPAPMAMPTALPPPPAAAAPAAAPAPIPAPTAVAPNPGFLAPPGAAAAPPPPPAAPAAPVGPQMTAAAGATTYQAYIAAGWTDAQLRANGLMV